MAKSALNNKTLAITFIALIVLVAATQFFNWGKQERNFRKELVNIDTAAIQTIELVPKKQNKPIHLKPSNGSWTVSKGDIEAPANSDQVSSMLTTLNGLKVNRVAATEQSKWSEYEVTDSLGTQVTIEQANDETMKVVVGKFNMNRRTRSATSFVRVSGDDKVYAVEGFLATTLNRKFSDWRDKTVIEGTEDDWTKLAFSYPSDSSFKLRKKNGAWIAGNQPVDSASVQSYLSDISNLTSQAFRDDFDAAGKEPFAKLTIQQGKDEAITVKAYGSSQQPVIHSSKNPESYFDGSKNELYRKIFASKEQLISSTDM